MSSKSEQRRRAVQGATTESDEKRDVGRVDLDALDALRADATVDNINGRYRWLSGLEAAYPAMRDKLRELRTRPPFPTPGKIAAMEAELQELRAAFSKLQGELQAARKVVEYFRNHDHYSDGKSDPTLKCAACRVIKAYDEVVK